MISRRAAVIMLVAPALLAALGLAARQDPPPAPPPPGDDPAPPAAVVAPPAAIAPPTTHMSNCTTGGCHSEQTQRPHVHGPVAVGACEVCHTVTDPAAHQFALKRQPVELCSFCHLGGGAAPGMHVHAPVAQGQCLECHDPHGSSTSALLVADPGELCLSCHREVIAGRGHQHTPVAEGRCTECHQAHQSPLPALLVEQGRDLCLRCHADVAPAGILHALAAPEPLEAGERGVLAEHAAIDTLHPPVLGDCSQCHEVHASAHEALLVEEPVDLCITCHGRISTIVAEAPFAHSAVTDGRACLNCHAPHHGIAGLLHEEPRRLCLRCHAEPVQRPDGTMVAAVNEILDPEMNPHGPVGAGDCRACHAVHGAHHRALLEAPHPAGMYEPFSEASYGLCFACHDPQLALAERTTDATGFRDGDLNLHHVHVNREKGRSCSVCHATHASPNAHDMRDSILFGAGGWKLPIGFESTDEGGRCASGCHQVKEYRR